MKWFKNLFENKRTNAEDRKKSEAIAAEKLRIIEAREEQRKLDEKLKNFQESWKAYKWRVANGWLNLKRPPVCMKVKNLNNLLPFQKLKDAAKFFSEQLQKEVSPVEVQIGHFVTPGCEDSVWQEIVYRYQDNVIVFDGELVQQSAYLAKIVADDAFVPLQVLQSSEQAFQLGFETINWPCIIKLDASLVFDKSYGLICKDAALRIENGDWCKRFEFDYPKEVSAKLFFENLRQVFIENY